VQFCTDVGVQRVYPSGSSYPFQVKPHQNASVAWGCHVRLEGFKKRSYLLAAPFIVIAVHGVRSPDRMNQRMIDSQIVDFGKRQHVQAHFG
jgi:hypothetical protein